MEMFYILNHWHWWALASLLVIVEFLGPCVYFWAIAIAAAIVGLIVRFMPELAGLLQLGLFIALSLILLVIARSIRQKRGDRRPVDSRQE